MPEISSARLQLPLSDLDALYGSEDDAEYPHIGKTLDAGVASFIENLAREQKRKTSLELEIDVSDGTSSPSAEAAATEAIHTYFATEGIPAIHELKVNQNEGNGSLMYVLPSIIVMLVAITLGAFFFIANPADVPIYVLVLPGSFLVILLWVFIWDPLEKILFNSYFLQFRVDVLKKLATVPIRYVYGKQP